jgi:hypothetical protein
MVHLEPNVLVQMLVLILSYPTLGVVAVMEIMRVAYPAWIPLLLILFLWERIAVMDYGPALHILGISFLEVQASILVKEVGELNFICTFNTTL